PMAHVPLHPGAAFRGRSPRGLYSDVIEELDHEIGRLLDAIDEAGLRERTLVIVASDNGPWLSYGGHAGSSGPFREGKGTTFEGGVRVPFLARWPGRIPAGSRSAAPLMTIDVLPTLAALCGAARPNAKIDGRDASAVLLSPETAPSPHEALFFWYRDNELQALRSGRWKLHFPHVYRTLAGAKGRDDGRPIDYEMTRCGLELYDLDRDPGETRDLAARHPEVVKRLQGLAEGARRELGDSLTGRAGEEVRSPGRVDDR
ncbi:MAG: sulfatase-like hydrolase/transferase, partial [Planctomycetota bacterium]